MKRVPSQEDIREVAFKLLGRRELTERELAERLLRKGFTESRITEVLTDLKQLGYIDDRSLCERLVKYLAVEKLQGDRRIELTLRARGVPPAIIGEALANVRKEFSEAEAMAKKAESWKAYNQAAVTQLIIEKLPELARAIAEPLAKTEKIVVINSGGESAGASKITKDVTNVIAQLPPVIEALSGIKLEDLVTKLPKLGDPNEKQE